MEALHPTSGFTSEASFSGRPHTPPYTPARIVKRRLERSDSPASTVGSIHPADTHSPAKKAAKRVADDAIQVEELVEGDLGYMTDIDVVYPEELEEISSSSSSSDDENNQRKGSYTSDSEATKLTRRLSRLRTGDDQEVDFEHLRRQRHLDKRASLRLQKRSHSQSVKSEPEVTDTNALNDHDLKSTQRRLRRRTRGPDEMSVPLEDHLHSSPNMCDPTTPTGSLAGYDAAQSARGDAMDLDSSKL